MVGPAVAHVEASAMSRLMWDVVAGGYRLRNVLDKEQPI